MTVFSGNCKVWVKLTMRWQNGSTWTGVMIVQVQLRFPGCSGDFLTTMMFSLAAVMILRLQR